MMVLIKIIINDAVHSIVFKMNDMIDWILGHDQSI
jgi:hypothetical protein